MPTPQKGFIKELKSIDSKLDVKWNTHFHRYMIYHTDIHNRKYIVMKIQYKDGSYKPLDQRTIQSLKYSNYLRGERPQELLYKIDRENELLEQKKLKDIRDNAKQIAVDIPKGEKALKDWAGGRF